MPDLSGTGVLQSRGKMRPEDVSVTKATIDGVDYLVPNFVLSYLSRHSDGATIDFQYTEGNGGRRLKKVTDHKKGSSTPSAEKKEERELHPVTVIAVSPMSISFQFMEGQKNKSSLPMTDSGYKIVTTTLNGKVPPVDAAISWNPSTGFLNDFKISGVNISLEDWDTLVKKYQPHPEEFKPAATLPKAPVGGPGPAPIPAKTAPVAPSLPKILPPPNTTITFSAKVNLDHNEMLAVSVSGEAADREALVAYLDESLSLFGRDEVTRERVNAYRKRVLPVVPA